MIPTRKFLPHIPPRGIHSGVKFFITIGCRERFKNQLALAEIATHLQQSAVYYHKNAYWFLHLFLLMPDHLHAIVSFYPTHPMEKVIRDWKRWCSRQYRVIWQRDFFDHRLRDDASLAEKAFYIRQNPIRKGLVVQAEQWPYVWDRNYFESCW